MVFVINETGEHKELHYITENGVDCVQDIIGNSGAIGREIKHDREEKVYRVNQADFDWWEVYLANCQKDWEELSSLYTLYGRDAVEEIIIREDPGHIDYDQEHEHYQKVLAIIRKELGGTTSRKTQNAIAARVPTHREWESLVDAIDGSNDLLHWKHMHFWCRGKVPFWKEGRWIRGWVDAQFSDCSDVTSRHADTGFRPVLTSPIAGVLPDGAMVIAAATLYMDGNPVRVPKNPVCDGDIVDYVPGAKLEFGPALPDESYRISAIASQGVLVADRVLIRNISWQDLEEQGFC
jgi:hypothetical protein